MVLDEDLDVCLIRNHLDAISHFICLVANALARDIYEIRVLFQRKLHEVDLPLVGQLDSVENLLVVRMELIDNQVDVVYAAFVLLLGLVGSKLLLGNLGMWRVLKVNTVCRLVIQLSFQLL